MSLGEKLRVQKYDTQDNLRKKAHERLHGEAPEYGALATAMMFFADPQAVAERVRTTQFCLIPPLRRRHEQKQRPMLSSLHRSRAAYINELARRREVDWEYSNTLLSQLFGVHSWKEDFKKKRFTVAKKEKKYGVETTVACEVGPNALHPNMADFPRANYSRLAYENKRSPASTRWKEVKQLAQDLKEIGCSSSEIGAYLKGGTKDGGKERWCQTEGSFYTALVVFWHLMKADVEESIRCPQIEGKTEIMIRHQEALSFYIEAINTLRNEGSHSLADLMVFQLMNYYSPLRGLELFAAAEPEINVFEKTRGVRKAMGGVSLTSKAYLEAVSGELKDVVIEDEFNNALMLGQAFEVNGFSTDNVSATAAKAIRAAGKHMTMGFKGEFRRNMLMFDPQLQFDARHKRIRALPDLMAEDFQKAHLQATKDLASIRPGNIDPAIQAKVDECSKVVQSMTTTLRDSLFGLIGARVKELSYSSSNWPENIAARDGMFYTYIYWLASLAREKDYEAKRPDALEYMATAANNEDVKDRVFTILSEIFTDADYSSTSGHDQRRLCNVAKLMARRLIPLWPEEWRIQYFTAGNLGHPNGIANRILNKPGVLGRQPVVDWLSELLWRTSTDSIPDEHHGRQHILRMVIDFITLAMEKSPNWAHVLNFVEGDKEIPRGNRGEVLADRIDGVKELLFWAGRTSNLLDKKVNDKLFDTVCRAAEVMAWQPLRALESRRVEYFAQNLSGASRDIYFQIQAHLGRLVQEIGQLENQFQTDPALAGLWKNIQERVAKVITDPKELERTIVAGLKRYQDVIAPRTLGQATGQQSGVRSLPEMLSQAFNQYSANQLLQQTGIAGFLETAIGLETDQLQTARQIQHGQLKIAQEKADLIAHQYQIAIQELERTFHQYARSLTTVDAAVQSRLSALGEEQINKLIDAQSMLSVLITSQETSNASGTALNP
jgi:hypothetical protein